MILGRGSFTESFPLFGYDLARLRELFEEKLDLFAKLLSERAGDLDRHDAAAADATSASTRRTESGTLRTWVGVGGSPRVGRPRRAATACR